MDPSSLECLEATMFQATFWAGLVFIVLALGFEHYFFFHRKLPRLLAYILGTAVLLIGQGIWLVPIGKWTTLIGLAALDMIGGAAVILMYLYDKATRADLQGRAIQSQTPPPLGSDDGSD